MQRKKETLTTLVRKEDIEKKWYIFDAKGKTLGRLTSEITKVLRGKHKTSFTPNVDMGDGVIVINAEHVQVTGAKEAQKMYRYYTGHIGGLREIPYSHMHARKPEYIITRAVQGMMPKSRLGKQQLRKLRVVKGENHSFQAQQPTKVEI
ncbi:MAG: 50S ribosomal protein L13 [Verrucomicrobia bacterium]|nr:50S ribosomal protein L13 [Verrucomicrobiota bacterium]